MKRINCIKLFWLLTFFVVNFSQTSFASFYEDSLKIVSNFEELSPKESLKIKDVIQLLNAEVQSSSDEVNDLVYYYLANYFFDSKQFNEAEKILRLKLNDSYNSNHSDAKFHHLKGILLASKKEYFYSIQTLLKAASGYKKRGETLKEATIFGSISDVYMSLGDYSQAYKYMSKCFEVYKRNATNRDFVSILGKLAICENNLDQLSNAQEHIALGFELLESREDVQGEIVINFAKSEWEYINKNYFKALPYSMKSLKLSEKIEDTQFENLNTILLMKIHNQLGEYYLSIEYGLRSKDKADLDNNLYVHHSITNGLARAYAGLGEFEKAYYYKKITDSVKTVNRENENKTRMDSLLVQFQALTDQNKILNQEAIIARQEASLKGRQNIVIALILLILGVLMFYQLRVKLIRNRQERRIAEAINLSEEAERNRLASELHDGLAAELTALKLELELNTKGSERALEVLKKAHQMTRSISHNLSTYFISEKGLIEAVSNLVANYNLKNNIQFYSNIEERLYIKPKVETILYRSVQELMQNAIKYSNSSEIIVQVLKSKNILSISVEDNGTGFDPETTSHSLGFRSLVNRIQLINGELNIESSPGDGTTAFITLKID